jgi:hypothetical protein
MPHLRCLASQTPCLYGNRYGEAEMSGRPRQFAVDLEIRFTPLPPEKAAAYWHAITLLADLVTNSGQCEVVNDQIKENTNGSTDPYSLVSEI